MKTGRRWSRQQLYLLLSFIAAATGLNGQSQLSQSEYIAFRVDDGRVIATVLVRGSDRPQVREGLSPRPIAQFGYEHFEPPDTWGDLQTDHRAGDRWLIHVAPGRALDAKVERMVGGYLGCQEAIGALLRVAPHQTKEFSAVRPRYFVVTPAKEKRRARLPGNHPFARCLRTR